MISIYSNKLFGICADMAELADAPDLGSGPRGCRFKSCYPQLKNLYLTTLFEFVSYFVSYNAEKQWQVD